MVAVRNTETNSYEDTLAFDEACDIRAGHGWFGQLIKDMRLSFAGPSQLFPLSLSRRLRAPFCRGCHRLGVWVLLVSPCTSAGMVAPVKMAPQVFAQPLKFRSEDVGRAREVSIAT